jgi:hypothetical protein
MIPEMKDITARMLPATVVNKCNGGVALSPSPYTKAKRMPLMHGQNVIGRKCRGSRSPAAAFEPALEQSFHL